MNPALARIKIRDTHRLIPSRFPPAGILDTIAEPGDLEIIAELEGWSNDRLSGQLGLLHTIPRSEWVTGVPCASVIMAAYCHPSPGGSRFNGPERGAWYSTPRFETAIAETVHHRTEEFREIGVFDSFVDMRQYISDFDTHFHDIRPCPPYEAAHDPGTYEHSQALAATLRATGSKGLIYKSVRRPPDDCLCCFRPALIRNVRPGAHFRYVWNGRPEPAVVELPA